MTDINKHGCIALVAAGNILLLRPFRRAEGTGDNLQILVDGAVKDRKGCNDP